MFNATALFSNVSDTAVNVTIEHTDIAEYYGASFGASDAATNSSAVQVATLLRRPDFDRSANSGTNRAGSVFLRLPEHPVFPQQPFIVSVDTYSAEYNQALLLVRVFWDDTKVELQVAGHVFYTGSVSAAIFTFTAGVSPKDAHESPYARYGCLWAP